MSQRLGFGVFLAPHHPIGEHPTLQFQRDLELATWIDKLQYDEFWVGEHHSAGWETIGSPVTLWPSKRPPAMESNASGSPR